MNQKIESKKKVLAALREDLAGFEKKNTEAAGVKARAQADLSALETEIHTRRVDAVLDPKAEATIPDLRKEAARLRDVAEEADIQDIAYTRKISELKGLLARAEEDERQAIKDVLRAALADMRDRYQKALAEYVAIFEALSVGVGEMAQLGGLGQLKEKLPELIGFPPPVHGAEVGANAPSVLTLERGHDGLRRKFPFQMTKEHRAEVLSQLLK